jgi:hypothetical protein
MGQVVLERDPPRTNVGAVPQPADEPVEGDAVLGGFFVEKVADDGVDEPLADVAGRVT